MKLYKQLQKYKPIEVPYKVWVCFGQQSKLIHVAGDQASLGEDYVDLEQLREAISWYADQLGGKITWSKEKKEKINV
jgi:hypothetical protein